MTAILAVVGMVGRSGVTLTDTVVDDTAIAPAHASATYTLSSSGSEWLLGGTPSSYEVMATPTSGTFSSGTTGSWLNLGTTRSWNVEVTTSSGTKSCTATFQIRAVADPGTILATATVTLSATVSLGGGA